MRIDKTDIQNGSKDGEIVWVCDYRVGDFNAQAQRVLVPTEVMVMDNKECSATVHYSESHFQRLSKARKPLKSKIIKLFDNTGYRFFTGNAIHVFDNEKECIEHFHKQMDEILARLEISKIKQIENLNHREQVYKNLRNKF